MKWICFVLAYCSVAMSQLFAHSFAPHMKMDSTGYAVAVWENDASPDTIFASTFTGGVWAAPTAISSPGVSSLAPAIDMDSSGNVVAVWVITNLGVTSLVSAKLAKGGAWTPPVMVSNGVESVRHDRIEGGRPSYIVTINDVGDILAIWNAYIADVLTIRANRATFPGGWIGPVNVSP
jgi:hypothetical protein